MRKPDPSDLTPEPWAVIEHLIPVHKVGRPRTNDIREVLNALFYLNRSGGQWDRRPHDRPAKSTVSFPGPPCPRGEAPAEGVLPG